MYGRVLVSRAMVKNDHVRWLRYATASLHDGEGRMRLPRYSLTSSPLATPLLCCLLSRTGLSNWLSRVLKRKRKDYFPQDIEGETSSTVEDHSGVDLSQVSAVLDFYEVRYQPTLRVYLAIGASLDKDDAVEQEMPANEEFIVPTRRAVS